MSKWYCDGGCGLEFGGKEEAQYKSRVIIKDPPNFTGSHKLFLCNKCGKKLMAWTKNIRITREVLNGKYYREVGKTFEISGERVRQIFHSTIRILRSKEIRGNFEIKSLWAHDISRLRGSKYFWLWLLDVLEHKKWSNYFKASPTRPQTGPKSQKEHNS
jgi:hypothetical protein